ncbi:glycosyltransferase family 2 protein [Sphingobium algorifonticola]|uniref:Glycosyltransferase n=1 Tax=Sphingobium algorifonticola TaxID=2008318 RepID=A0A437JDI5_9SPHN|nr:glycosyltransferase [Sphingobium algorifonticola]RVT43951.1 glycosyltransferase [Sphingobium algorifonticola]
MSKLTLICSFYNREQGVLPTLHSIARQRFRDFEAIIIDDGSTDGTSALLRRELQKLADSRLIFRTNVVNVGLTQSLIQAIASSSTPYIAIHDAGDVSLPDRLSRQVEMLDADPTIAAVGCHYINVLPERNLHVMKRPDASGESFRSILRRPAFTHGEVAFRRDVYETVGGYRPEFRYAQDNDLWLRMIRVARFSTVPEILYHRMIYASGISQGPRTFVEQAAFYTLGRIIAQDPHFEHVALSRLRSGAHIHEILPLDDARIQALILRKTLRHMLFGDTEAAKATFAAYSRWAPLKLLKPLLSIGCRLSARGHNADGVGLVRTALRIQSGLPWAPLASSPDELDVSPSTP